MADGSAGKQATTTEEFRFRGWKLGGIAVVIGLAGLLLTRCIWQAASMMGFFSIEASGADFGRAQTNLLLVALLLVGTALLAAGTILIFAETKSVTATATAQAESEIGANDAGAAAKIGAMIADGMSRLKGGSVAIFCGVALFVVAAWIATAGISDNEEGAGQDGESASSAEASSGRPAGAQDTLAWA